MRNIRVLVTGAGGPAGMGTIKSLTGIKGIDIVAADMNPLAAGLFWTPYRIVVPPVGSRNYTRQMLDVVKKHRIDVLFPTVDEEIEPISANIEKFEKITHLLISPLNSVLSCTDKYATFCKLKDDNVPVVNTVKIDTKKDLNRAIKALGFPMIVKPMASRGGRGLFYCKDKKELIQRYEELKNMLPFNDTYYNSDVSHEIICQEYLPGTEYDNVTLTDKRIKIVANVPMKAEEWDVKYQRRTIVTEHNKVALNLAKKTIEAFKLVGPIDIEMKFDRKGVLKVLDVNPRVGGDVELATFAGCNIPYMTVNISLGKILGFKDFNDNFVLIRYQGIQTMKKDEIPVMM